MDKIQDAIAQMEEAGNTKDEMVVLLEVDYAKKILKDTNDILLTPMKEFKTIYGVDCKVLWNLPGGTFYIVTKKYLKEAGL
jgi:hypothetical protein